MGKEIKILKFRESLKYLTAFFQIRNNRLKYFYATIIYKVYRKNLFPPVKLKLFNKIFVARRNSTDIPILSSFYERETTKFIMKGKKNIFIDIGAHIGRYSILATKNSSKVFSIEPSKANFQILKKNIKINHLDKKIKPIKKGILDKNGFQDLYFYESNEGFSTFDISSKENNTIRERCKIEKLDFLVQKLRLNIKEIDLIKIDVEGPELKVLEGAKKILKRGRPSLVIEALSRKKEKELSNFLKKFDYHLEDILDGRNLLFKKTYNGK
jgi:FkbM family methyltransferase